jgi:hypothetical protein
MIIAAIGILVCGACLGWLGAWYHYDGRVSFWQDKFEAERMLKDRILKQNTDALFAQLETVKGILNKVEGNQ